MWKQVMPLFVIAVLVGWFMPADPASYSRGEKAEAAKIVAAAQESSLTAAPRKPNLPDMPGDGVILGRKTDGHFYAEASANGMPVRFLVDTGASVVALTAADAQRLGLFWNQNELQNVGRGVNGDVMGKPVEVAELRLGGLSAQNVRAVIIPYGLDVSLLGQSFLSKVGHVTISGDQMMLKN
jgi:aspartyl protease family protein